MQNYQNRHCIVIMITTPTWLHIAHVSQVHGYNISCTYSVVISSTHVVVTAFYTWLHVDQLRSHVTGSAQPTQTVMCAVGVGRGRDNVGGDKLTGGGGKKSWVGRENGGGARKHGWGEKSGGGQESIGGRENVRGAKRHLPESYVDFIRNRLMNII